MSPFGQLLLILIAMGVGAVLMLPQQRAMSKLFQSQLNSLASTVENMNQSHNRFLSQIFPTLLSSTTSSVMSQMTTMMKVHQNELTQPLLTHQEALVNRLITKDAMSASQLDASLVSRDALKKQPEYLLQTDQAEAERLEDLLKTNFTDDLELSGLGEFSGHTDDT